MIKEHNFNYKNNDKTLKKKGQKKSGKKVRLKTLSYKIKKIKRVNKINKSNKVTKITKIDHKVDDKKTISYKNLNDTELNTMKYELALQYDKRTYFQYYWSLVKKKHIILFAFYPVFDYNLVTIKICYFLVSFSLYFTINGFFFSDGTMHNIHINNYTFIRSLPQLILSSIISAIVHTILRHLSLSEYNFIDLKMNMNNGKEVRNQAKIITYRSIKIKFFLFFLVSYLLLLFFWYFLSCFCAIYINTQIILIKDTLISFAFSLVYPFGLSFIPGIFRISAMRAEKKDKPTMYHISRLLDLFI